MPKTTCAAALLAALLLLPLPAASAGWLKDEPVSITLPLLRVGDRMLFETHLTPAADPEDRGPLSVIILVEDVGREHDRFGLERAVETFRIDTLRGGEVVWSERCHRLQGGHEAVVREPLAFPTELTGGGSSGSDFGIGGSTRSELNTTPIAWFGGGCEGAPALHGRTFQEGDLLALVDLMPSLAEGPAAEARSEPAAATSAHGRAALRFVFDAVDVMPWDDRVTSIEVVLADGLPTVLSVTFVGPVPGAYGTRELVGIERGAGPELAPYRGERLPIENPVAKFRAPERLVLDDRAFQLGFPYAEAFALVERDPRAILWFRDHPDAYLSMASFTRDGREETALPVGRDTQGSWWLVFRDGEAGLVAFIDRLEGVWTGAGAVPFPVDLPWTTGASEMSLSSFPDGAPPERVADSAALARLVASRGVATSDIATFAYWGDSLHPGAPALLFVSTVPTDVEETAEGLDLLLNVTAGALESVAAISVRTTREPGLLDVPRSGSLAVEAEASMTTALSALAGPGVGSGLAVGGAAATGLAILIVVLKLVAIPLFTRLRKDRLLDNPVRARLYERVRAEPGIHLAELEEFLGIGRGATRHHVDQLVRHRLLVEARGEGFTRYFAAGEVPPDVARRETLLRAGSAREVYELFRERPTLSLREAGARLGLSAPSVHRTKKRLEKAGLLPAAPEARVEAA